MKIEKRLIEKTIEGDMDSSKQLFSKLYTFLMPYFLKRGLSYYDSEDATQEVLMKLITHLDTYMEKGKFMIFVFSIARNVFIDFVRYKQKNLVIFTEEMDAFDEEHVNLYEKVEFLEMIKHLTVDDQEIIILRFYYGLKMREISEIVELPMRTVQSRLRILQKKIKEETKNE